MNIGLRSIGHCTTGPSELDRGHATWQAAQTEPTTTYESTTFRVPFEVVLPPWVNTRPAAALPDFITWESPDCDRSIRFLASDNDHLSGSDPQTQSLHRLLGLSHNGATIEEVVDTTVDGRPATMMTATSSSGAPDLIMRIAVVDIECGRVLIWMREAHGGENDGRGAHDSFASMLATLHFRGEPSGAAGARSRIPSDPSHLADPLHPDQRRCP
jgi:hypothetical protein